jgi:hypothetical protein
MNFIRFLNWCFNIFILYNYIKYKFHEQTDNILVFISYNFVYFYSKLQIILNKNKNYNHLCNKLQIIYDNVNTIIEKKNCVTSIINDKITLDFVLNNEIIITVEKDEFLDTFYVNKKITCKSVLDYDFIIINGNNNMKKIIQNIKDITNDDKDIKNDDKDIKNDDKDIKNDDKDIKNDDKHEHEDEDDNETIFKIEPLNYNPILFEIVINDTTIKIDLKDDNKFYNYLVLNNSLDKCVITYFMKKYYNIDITENYTLKILDENIVSHSFNSSNIVKFEKINIKNIINIDK